ncbi:monovalent cation/H(+) antiporter subunit G [Yoonia sp. I 8.24]|uniref:monovalent cation/H(+) antiporter subunit G n=1 Tax=Yoonia sp. I 8.24 TaxID=1537229 RepID=UPI001EDDD7E3|nr:monovalent cation/H(+) antiporter subunit G [Yoonia sp. I 8.24]MCG3268212.1 monovalent cation/H(+) antiporter subunit G [Yoonia sp. I 8.24]
MSIDIIGTYAVAFCLLIGSFFTIVGVIGMLKFDTPMSRLHAPTKVGTVGVGMLLAASMLHSFVIGQTSIHELLIMGFLFVTAPISANFIAKVNIHRGDCEAPPSPPQDDTWSTLDTPQEDRNSEGASQ